MKQPWLFWVTASGIRIRLRPVEIARRHWIDKDTIVDQFKCEAIVYVTCAQFLSGVGAQRIVGGQEDFQMAISAQN